MFLKEYERWLTSNILTLAEKEELKSIENDEKEIEERFYTNLTFGTGGMRGVRGIGTNRMNKYNIRKATQGLANYIIETTGDIGKEKGVVISYDCRLDSKENAENTAMVLAGNGIKVYLFKSLRTTPECSFATRELRAQAGVMITASHNPKEYNGYKVYWQDGGQIVDVQADGIVSAVNNVDVFNDIKLMDFDEALVKGVVEYISEEIDDKYIEAVKKNSLNKEIKGKKDFKIVYSPLHGTAGRPVLRVLKEMGFENIEVVKEQIEPNGNFPTCSYANPEDTSVFKLSIDLANKVGAKLCIANDPDGDRVGIAILDDNGKWFMPNGNQIGLLFLEYIINNTKIIPADAKIVTTIVSTPLIDTIANQNGVGIYRTLTGFKYIGQKISQFEAKIFEGTYLFGYEESIGYLIGAHVRDKDAVVSSMIVAEMAAYYDAKGSSLYREINKIYEKYGWRLERTVSVTKSGKDGLAEITKIMKNLKTTEHKEINGIKVKESLDFSKGIKGLPKSDVVQLILEDETYLTVRPSGTEPKIKYYISVVDTEKTVAEIKLEKIVEEFKKYVESL